jgi:hypothetical protein
MRLAIALTGAPMKWFAGTLILCIALKSHAADLKHQVDAYRAGHEAAIVGQLDQPTRLNSGGGSVPLHEIADTYAAMLAELRW